MPAADISGLTLAYSEAGSGDPVVFVHGLGGSSNCWAAQLEECRSRGLRGVAYDQRGAGRSEKPPGPYSVKGWAEDLRGLLDALGIGRAALVGHSVGCMVAEAVAAGTGDRVSALVLCGGAREWPPEAGPAFEQRIRLARSGNMDEIAEQVAGGGLSQSCRQEDPRLLGLMRELIASNDPAAYAESAAATAAGTMVALDRVECPVLAFCGSEDTVTPPSASTAIAESVADGHTATVEGAAHWCMLEDPGATNEVIFGFLDRLG